MNPAISDELIHLLTLLTHSASCRNRACEDSNCYKMRAFLRHGVDRTCGLGEERCVLCKRLVNLIHLHSRLCTVPVSAAHPCPVPWCTAYKLQYLEEEERQQRRRRGDNNTRGGGPHEMEEEDEVGDEDEDEACDDEDHEEENDDSFSEIVTQMVNSSETGTGVGAYPHHHNSNNNFSVSRCASGTSARGTPPIQPSLVSAALSSTVIMTPPSTTTSSTSSSSALTQPSPKTVLTNNNARYMRQIIHALHCPSEQCGVEGCALAKHRMRHVQSCASAIGCDEACMQTRYLILHYSKCQGKAGCRICGA